MSLVPEARGGPFVYHDGLADGCARAAAAGFDAVEIFARSAAEFDSAELRRLLAEHRLSAAAFGTGAGWVVRKLTLISPDAAVRAAAQDFIAEMIALAGQFGAPAIIGSMQGRLEAGQDREQAFGWLRKSLTELATQASTFNVPLLLEPLNRYETNVFNQLGETAEFVKTLATKNVRLLADLFHMNIEEVDIAAALKAAAPFVSHIHLADSNRRAMGLGHTELEPIKSAIQNIGYNGYLSAEIFPLPNANAAAKQTRQAIRNLIS